MLDRVPPTMSRHPNFVRDLGRTSETSFRDVLHHREDEQRELTLAVLVFDLPAHDDQTTP